MFATCENYCYSHPNFWCWAESNWCCERCQQASGRTRHHTLSDRWTHKRFASFFSGMSLRRGYAVSIMPWRSSFLTTQNMIHEARLCIADCEEVHADGASFLEETKHATDAVDNAFAAYSELLDELRSCTAEQQRRHAAARNSVCTNMKALRHDLCQLHAK